MLQINYVIFQFRIRNDCRIIKNKNPKCVSPMKTSPCLKNLLLAVQLYVSRGQSKLRFWWPLQLTVVLALSGGGSSALAQTSYTWNGGSGTTGNWSDGANWGGSGPTSPQGFLNFNGATRTSNTNDFSSGGSGYQFYFKSGASAFNLYGNLVVFYDFSSADPNIQNEGTSPTQTINFPIANGNNNGSFHVLNINVNAGTSQGPLTFNGAVSSADAGQALRVINLYGSSAINFNGVISDFDSTHKLALSQLGTGTTTLTASNTFTGDMTVNAGTLVLATNSALANGTNFVRLGDTAGSTGVALNLNSGNNFSTSINVRSGSSGGKVIANTLGTIGSAMFLGNLYLDDNVTAYANANGTNVFSGATLDLKSQTLTVDGTGNTIINGTLTNSIGSGKLVKNNTGVLTLSGNNFHAGGTTLNTGGTININSTNALGTGVFTIGGSATVFDNTSGAAISNANNNALTISGGSPTFAGTKDLNFGTGVVMVIGNNRTLTVSASTLTLGGGVTDNGGARKLTKAGAGTLILNGAAGVWTGGSSLDAGTLVVGTDTTLGTGNLALNGGTLVATNGARSLANPVTLTASSAIGGNIAITFSSSGSIINSGGSRALTNNNTAGITLSGPVYLSDDNTTAGRTVTLLGSGNTTVSGVIANNNVGNTVAVNMVFSNTATTTISGANTYTGKTFVNAGTLAISAGANVGGSPTSATTNQITINGGTLLATNGAATITLPANVGITVGASGATIDVATNLTLDYPAQAVSGTGTLTKNGAGVFQIDESTASSTYTNLILNSGTMAFNKSSGGLGAGLITINGGVIRTTGVSSRSPNNPFILVNGDFTLGSPTTAAISFANSGAWMLANGTRIITVDTITATITGVVGDGGNGYGLTKAGSGTLVLSGTENYSGVTAVKGGVLLVSGVLGTNCVAVSTNATLSGNGVINGATTVQLGGTVQPGLGGLDTSTFAISNSLTLAGNVILTLDRTNAQTAAKISGVTSVTYGGTLIVTNVGSALQSGDTFTLFQATNYSGSFATIILPSLGTGLTWNTNNLVVKGSISVGLAISPTTLALSSSENSSGYLDPLTFTATVTPTNASGNVIFFNGATPFSTNTLVLGIATSSSSSILPRGTNTITAIYSGDINYHSSTNSLAQVVTNHPPVANENTYTRHNLPSWKVAVSDLLTNISDADGDTLSLIAVGNSTNGVTLDTNSFPGYVAYYNSNIVTDQFTCFVADGYGGTNSATITLNAVSPASSTGQVATLTVTGGVASMTFLGITGFTYNVQRATNDVTGPWFTIWTTNAPTGGAFQFDDPSATSPCAYYRLMW